MDINNWLAVFDVGAAVVFTADVVGTAAGLDGTAPLDAVAAAAALPGWIPAAPRPAAATPPPSHTTAASLSEITITSHCTTSTDSNGSSIQIDKCHSVNDVTMSVCTLNDKQDNKVYSSTSAHAEKLMKTAAPM